MKKQNNTPAILGIKERIYDAVYLELERANTKHPDQFASRHEGYAVLLEEFQEFDFEYRNMENQLKYLWSSIKKDKDIESLNYYLKDLKEYTDNALLELIQIRAMIDKFEDSDLD